VRLAPPTSLREPCPGGWRGGCVRYQPRLETLKDFRFPISNCQFVNQQMADGLRLTIGNRQLEIGNRKSLKSRHQKNRPLHGGGTACVGEVLRGGGKNVYIDGGAVGLAAVGCCCAGAVASPVLVINRTSTRRFLARPSRVLLLSTGLSLPSPIR
jgi:hypothetical protein